MRLLYVTVKIGLSIVSKTKVKDGATTISLRISTVNFKYRKGRQCSITISLQLLNIRYATCFGF